MNKEEVLNIINNKKDCYPQIIKANYRKFYDIIVNKYDGKKFGEKLYRWLREGTDYGKCSNCKNDTKFMSISVGFTKYCSKKCSNIATADVRAKILTHDVPDPNFWIEKLCKLCGKSFFSFIKRNGVFCSNECSVKFTANDKNRLNKIRETKLERYGNETFVNSEKAKATCLERYGVDNASKSVEIIEKLKLESKKRFFEKLQSHKLNAKTEPLFTWESYIDTNKTNKYKFKCKSCNDIFEDHIDGGHLPRCLKCYPHIQNFSVVETEIVNFIHEILPNEKIETSNRNVISPLELDIYLPSKKIAIEYDGLFWHSEIGGRKDKYYHVNKTNKCKLKGVKLIHIFEDLWVNNSIVVKNRLKHIIGENNNRVYARKCQLREISYLESSDFLEKYHLQGNDCSSIRLGLFCYGELVSVMTFGSLRISLGNKNRIGGEYEMYRFCSSKNVIGAASKFLSYFVKKYTPTKIVSYADKCWSVGNVYEKIGFKLVSETSPNYFYTKDYLKRLHRYSFRKDVLHKKLELFNPELTEWENMQLNGYDRIWDCGHFKYEYKPTNTIHH